MVATNEEDGSDHVHRHGEDGQGRRNLIAGALSLIGLSIIGR